MSMYLAEKFIQKGGRGKHMHTGLYCLELGSTVCWIGPRGGLNEKKKRGRICSIQSSQGIHCIFKFWLFPTEPKVIFIGFLRKGRQRRWETLAFLLSFGILLFLIWLKLRSFIYVKMCIFAILNKFTNPSCPRGKMNINLKHAYDAWCIQNIKNTYV